MAKQKSFYTTQFWLLCASSVLFMASFNMLLGELPHYLDSIGGQAYKGLIIGLFALAALFSRPFSGRLSDTIGRVPVMIFGAFVCIAAGFIYPLLTTISGFLILRFLHGFSTGFKPTGTTAYLADIIPPNKRGEAMGILGDGGWPCFWELYRQCLFIRNYVLGFFHSGSCVYIGINGHEGNSSFHCKI